LRATHNELLEGRAVYAGIEYDRLFEHDFERRVRRGGQHLGLPVCFFGDAYEFHLDTFPLGVTGHHCNAQ